MALSDSDLECGILHCFRISASSSLPKLYDGGARPYAHSDGCFYFFSWLVRDAPAQRLQPIIRRIKDALKIDWQTARARTIAELMTRYREELATFSWDSVREVFIDRLEGSRRSLKGHEREIVIRTALASAVARYYELNRSYGSFDDVVVLPKQLTIERESYDGAVELRKGGKVLGLILVPVKTRETEGGGHSQLFSRDITEAIVAARRNSRAYVISVFVVSSGRKQIRSTWREFRT